jgi:hypothetical protein
MVNVDIIKYILINVFATISFTDVLQINVIIL